VLIRPDFHVFGTSPGDAASANLLVADLLRRVTHPAEPARSPAGILSSDLAETGHLKD
jgi:hypothetical protein